MSHCYLCGIGINNSNSHHEHIIQNAIGGSLAPSDILCTGCGNDLGRQVDQGFVDIFSHFASRLRIRIDRKTRAEARKYRGRTTLYISGESIEIDVLVVDDGEKVVVAPFTPKYKIIDGNIYAFCAKKKKKDYLKFLEKKLGDDCKNIEFIHDLNGFGFIVSDFSLENNVFRKGMAKIAAGFAAYSGVSRENMKCIININSCKMREDLRVVPYVPYVDIEWAIELVKPYVWDNDYVHHELRLFTKKICVDGEDRNYLICYIDLFGTFQYYVVIDDCYFGEDVSNEYFQKLFYKENTPISIPHPSELDIVLGDADLTHEDVDNLRRKCKSEEEFQRELLFLIQNGMNRKKYNENLSTYVMDIISVIYTAIIDIISGHSNRISEIIRRIIEIEDKHDFLDNYYELLESMRETYGADERFSIAAYKSWSSVMSDGRFSKVCSFSNACFASSEDRKRYGHLKFHLLSHFADKINPIVK